MEVFEPSPTGHGGHQEALGMPSIDTIGPTSSASKWSPAPFLFLKKKKMQPCHLNATIHEKMKTPVGVIS